MNAAFPYSDRVTTLLSENDIQRRVAELGHAISNDYRENHKLSVIGILKGSIPFYADLIRHITLDIQCDFMGISTYGESTKSSGIVKITSDLTDNIEGRDVLIVEDIVDTGLTLKYLVENIQTRRPKSIKICTLLEKPDNAIETITIDYRGFTISDHFVVGYGLDYAGTYRNLPFVGIYHGKT